MRVVGGRTNVWGRQSYRLSEQDLKGKSFDGYGDDWPIGYKDLAPYYDIVEDYVGISGSPKASRSCPTASSCRRWRCPAPRRSSGRASRTKLGYTVTIGRTANLSKPINGRAGRATTAGRASRAASRTRTSTPRSRPSQTRVEDGQGPRSSPNAMVYKVLTDP